MSVFAHVDGLGQVIEQCIADSVIAWRREFASAAAPDDTIAERLESVETFLSLRPAGVLMITVQVKGRGFLNASTEAFRAQRPRMGEWKVTASSIR